VTLPSRLPATPRSPSSSIPRDAREFAAAVAGLMAEEAVKEYLARIGRKGGLKGGKARAMKLSAQRRLEIARKAAKARWAKQPEEG
jgi:hypothetical protein